MSKTAVARVDAIPFDVELVESFGIATGRLDRAENVLVRIQLEDGTVGLGEAAPFPAVNGETRDAVLAGLRAAEGALLGLDVMAWRRVSRAAREALPHEVPSALCSVETAILDAFTRHVGISLWSFFGATEESLETDITLVTGDADRTRRAAERAAEAGFRVLKVKIGGASVEHDLERLRAVAEAAPTCRWILDGNTAMSVESVTALVDALGPARSHVVLLEQPTPAEDLDALGAVRLRTGISVAADESARSVSDVVAIAARRSANVVNLKITKSGVVEALDMALVARAQGLGLMIGGMVETSLAMTTSACLAAGLGGFSYVDLDTPLFMKDAPTRGGFAQEGARLGLAGIRTGHGVRMAFP